MTQSQTLLRVTDLRVAFGAHEVVKGINFHINAGEKLALVGESGSGKTLTALSLLGLVANARTSGQALLNGQDLLAMTEHQLRGVRGGDVAMIFQEPMTALNPLMTIGKQIAEIFQLKQGLTLDVSIKSAIDLLTSTGLSDPAAKAQAYPHQLSGGQRQRAMIAMALASAPKLLLADRPTTALDVSLRGQILELLATSSVSGAWRCCSSRTTCSWCAALPTAWPSWNAACWWSRASGGGVWQPAASVHPKLLNSRPQRDPLSPCAPPEGTASPLQAQNNAVAYPVPKPGIRGWFGRGQSVALKAADFALQPGQTLGVVGESGSGKSTLALAALDLIAFTGDLRVAGQPWAREAKANRRQRSQVQVVFQDPFSSLSPRMTVEQIVGEGLDVHAPGCHAAQRRERVLASLASVGLVDEGADHAQAAHALLQRYPHEFSGGQRQRLAIARALIVEPAVLVLDEPTSALDVTVQQQVMALLQRLQRERQLSYLLITHDMDVVRAMAHQVLVLQAGKVVEQGTWEQVLQTPQHGYTQSLLAAAGA